MDYLSKISSASKLLNVCHCCLKRDGFTDMSTYFLDSQEKETAEQILNSTFDIQLSSQLMNSKSLICEPCITSLRDAHNFKQMIIQSQAALSDYLKILHSDDKDETTPELKDSIKIEEAENELFNISCQEYDSPDDNEVLANLKFNNISIEESPVKRKKCKLEKRTKSKLCEIQENSEIVSDGSTEKDWKKISERRGKGPLLRDNSLKLIQNSNLCVFQWNKSQYRCFCCNTPFSDINLLKQHTFNAHTLKNIEKKIISQQNRLVKVEISNLECKLCREKLEDISFLKQHLSRTHSIVLSEDLLVPFRIENDLKCQICYEKFSVFRLLNIHINRHFQRQVCHICGAGFSNLVFLNLHRTRSHRSYDCKTCNLTFNNKTDKKQHDINSHGIKYERKLRFPCPFCPERFFQENFKVKHLVEKHGMTKPDFGCGVCSKSFLTRSLLNNHVKNVHNKEKNQECDVCHHFFYTKSDVARHKVTHTGEKKFTCEVCNNPFATRDSLRRHMKRTHIGVS